MRGISGSNWYKKSLQIYEEDPVFYPGLDTDVEAETHGRLQEELSKLQELSGPMTGEQEAAEAAIFSQSDLVTAKSLLRGSAL